MESPAILIIDEDAARRRRLLSGLSGRVVESLSAADVVVLGEVEGDPWALLRQWRLAGHRVGVVLLGAPAVTAGAQAAAGPLLTLPGSAQLAAVAAAVAALQAQVQAATVLALSDRRVDLRLRQVLTGDEAVSLSQREADLLAYLAARPGRMVTREELLLQVWEHVRVVPTRSVDMAVHRLRRKIEVDPRQPVHLLSCRGGGYQLVLPEAAPRASNIRPALTSFIGREQDCADLAGRLEAGCRLLTVTGAPGVGKTRLALELARRQEGQGVWVCDLYPARDLAGIYMAVAVALGLDTSAPWQTTAALVEQELVRRGEVLLILDNAEHVVYPLARIVPGLLAAARGLRLLVTSQAPLEVTGEWLHTLPPLPREDALALFAQRAAAAGRVSLEQPELAAEIVTLLDGLPLAIELAAARTRAMSLQDILSRLDQRFRLLQSRQHEPVPRHATLQACMAWAWNLLQPDEQAAMGQLSVFRGGLDLPAAAAVLSEDEAAAEALLHRLLDRSLLKMDLGVEGTTRFAMLESVRLFAQESWEQPEALRAAEDRHRAWMSGRAAQCVARSLGPGARAALAVLVEEAANLQQAWLSCGRGTTEELESLAMAMDFLLEARGSREKRQAQLAEALSLAQAPQLQARLLHRAATCAQGTAEAEQAHASFASALALLDAHPDDRRIAGVLISLAALQRRTRSLPRAHETLQRALRHAEAASSAPHIARARAGLAYLEGFLPGEGARVDSRLLFEEAAAALVAVEDYPSAIQVLLQRSTILYNLGDFGGMLLVVRRALKLLEVLPQEHLKGSLLGTLAIGLAKQGQLEEALETFERSMRCLRAVGHDQRLAAIRHYRGVTLFRLGRLAEARRDYEEELASMTALGDRRSQAHALEGLAQLAVAEGAPDRALKAASEGLAQAEGCGDVVLLADLQMARGLARFLCGDLDGAAKDYSSARRIAGEALPPEHVVFLDCLQASLAMAGGPPHPPPSPRGDAFGFRPLLDALRSPSPETLRALCGPAASPDILVRLAAVAASHAADHCTQTS